MAAIEPTDFEVTGIYYLFQEPAGKRGASKAKQIEHTMVIHDYMPSRAARRYMGAGVVEVTDGLFANTANAAFVRVKALPKPKEE